MDAIDAHILDILAVDGRASFSSIGADVGLSTNATAARIRRLERAGVILGYRAVLADERADPHRLIGGGAHHRPGRPGAWPLG